MDRRSFLAGAATLLTASLAAEAQPARKTYRIGWVSVASGPAAVDAPRRAFSAALDQLGYQEGKTFFIEDRFAAGSSDRLRALAAELVDLNVDVLVTEGTPAALAAKRATNSIPIVMMGPADPVGMGLVSSLARPGGNVTGVSAAYGDLAAKCVELLREVGPRISRIAFMGNAANVANRASFAKRRRPLAASAWPSSTFRLLRPGRSGPLWPHSAARVFRASSSPGMVSSEAARGDRRLHGARPSSRRVLHR